MRRIAAQFVLPLAWLALVPASVAAPLADDAVLAAISDGDARYYPLLSTDLYDFTTVAARIAAAADGGIERAPTRGERIYATLRAAAVRSRTGNRYLTNFRIPERPQPHHDARHPAREEQPGLLTLAIVPEPSTWAMMILGIGAVAAALRRRRPHRAMHA